jgi:hypothetical protein
MHHHIDQRSQQPAANKTINIIGAGKHIAESGAFGVAIDNDDSICLANYIFPAFVAIV